MLEILDLMQYCKDEANYEKARQELKTRFKREPGWNSVLALQKASSAVISVEVVEFTPYIISLFIVPTYVKKGCKYIPYLVRSQLR